MKTNHKCFPVAAHPTKCLLVNRTPQRGASLALLTFIAWTAMNACAQGEMEFANFVTPGPRINAPVTFSDGTKISGEFGYTAQLYFAPSGASLDALIPIPVISHFRLGIGAGYIIPMTVAPAGTLAGEVITVVMRAFDGRTWETSSCRGESKPIQVELGGGDRPPTYLDGLQGFSVNCVPEPSTIAILVFGTLWLTEFRHRDVPRPAIFDKRKSRSLHHRTKPLV